jgi:hypothetical protein
MLFAISLTEEVIYRYVTPMTPSESFAFEIFTKIGIIELE